MAIRADSATRVINCEIGDDLCGQFHRRICESIGDDLEANFLYIADGNVGPLLANLDLLGLFSAEDRQAMRQAAGVKQHFTAELGHLGAHVADFIQRADGSGRFSRGLFFDGPTRRRG